MNSMKNYMASIYGMVGAGLFITGLVSWASLASGFTTWLTINPLIAILFVLLPLATIFIIGMVSQYLGVIPLMGAYFLFTGLEGFGISMVLNHSSVILVTQAVGITAITFFLTSIFGFFTKRDLSGLGQILFMSLIGIIVAMLVGAFIHSTIFSLIVSILTVVVFALYMAYDTQNIKMNFNPNADSIEFMRDVAVGSLELYLDILNFFLSILDILNFLED